MRCFVVMGFGIKTDLATGRKLDLDMSYRLLIKPVVEEMGHECVRADEIRHSGTIDVPMYEQLLAADVVIADLSTANMNALYELGIRHALKPHTTVVISENQLAYPFDLNHVVIFKYAHHGDAIGFDEVMRFRGLLKGTLEEVLKRQKVDSPVYTFLKLRPPEALGGADATVQRAAASSTGDEEASSMMKGSIAALVAQGEHDIKADQFGSARDRFAAAIELSKVTAPDNSGEVIAVDPYLIQRHALAHYKAKQPDPLTALRQARDRLIPLNPAESNDPETVGLAGAIEKKLFELGQGDEHLSAAIRHYRRGFYLRNDWYNGINYAYLLNLRTSTALDPTRADRLADVVVANRIRSEIVALCTADLAMMGRRSQERLTEISVEVAVAQRERQFWCLATRAEAHYGLGNFEAYEADRAAAAALPAVLVPASRPSHVPTTMPGWMMGTFEQQIARLRALLVAQGELLEPPWRAPAE